MSLSEGVYNWTLTANLNHNNSTNEIYRMEWEVRSVMSMVILILTILLGVPDNGAVIWVTGFKMKTSAHTVCFLNLAVADLMFCLCLPSQIAEIFLIYTNFLQSVVLRLIMFLNAFASMYLLCLISIYRCLAVTRPIWFRKHLRLAWVRATCFVVWVIAIVIAIYLLMDHPPGTIQIFLPFSFGLPTVIMIICYAVVGWRMRGDRFTQSRKPVRLLASAIAAFLICWLPFSLSTFRLFVFDLYSYHWFIFTLSLASFNSALNPLIYVFAGSDFRQVFKRSLFASLQLAFTEQELQGETQNRNPTSDTNV